MILTWCDSKKKKYVRSDVAWCRDGYGFMWRPCDLSTHVFMRVGQQIKHKVSVTLWATLQANESFYKWKRSLAHIANSQSDLFLGLLFLTISAHNLNGQTFLEQLRGWKAGSLGDHVTAFCVCCGPADFMEVRPTVLECVFTAECVEPGKRISTS